MSRKIFYHFYTILLLNIQQSCRVSDDQNQLSEIAEIGSDFYKGRNRRNRGEIGSGQASIYEIGIDRVRKI